MTAARSQQLIHKQGSFDLIIKAHDAWIDRNSSVAIRRSRSYQVASISLTARGVAGAGITNGASPAL